MDKAILMLKKAIAYIKTHNIFRHALYITGVFIAVLVIASAFMGAYTQHGKAVRVPDVKNILVGDAEELLKRQGLYLEIIDSLYDTSLRPGVIMEQTPRSGSSVKRGRTVYLIINSISPQKFSIPDLTDISSRQAITLLEEMGFPTPEISYVSSRYKDLVIGVDYRGTRVEAGDKMPVNTKLVLLVGSGTEYSEEDSISNDSLPFISE